jgi:peptidoglycan/LPS O-acetylase OafA/YrhL
LVSAWGAFIKPGAAFFLLPFRSWELLSGSLIALSSHNLKLSRHTLHIVQIAGLISIGLGIYLIDKTTPFPGIFAFPVVGGAVALILPNDSDRTICERLLSWRPLVSIGLVSYPLYLTHWPALVFAREVAGGSLSASQTIVVLALCLLLSLGIYRLLEMPVRRRRILSKPESMFVAAASAAFSIMIFNIFLIKWDGYLLPVQQEVRSQILSNRKAIEEPINMCTGLNYRRPINQAADVRCRISDDCSVF